MKKLLCVLLAVAAVFTLASCALFHKCENPCPECGLCLNSECSTCKEKCPGHHTCQNVCDQCRLCLNPDCAEEVCAEKCQGHHTCQNICDQCQLCLNPECAEEVCSEKCQGHHVCESYCVYCGGCADFDCTEAVCSVKCLNEKSDTVNFPEGDYITTEPTVIDTGDFVYHIGSNIYVPGNLEELSRVVYHTMESVSGLDFNGNGNYADNYSDGKIHITVTKANGNHGATSANAKVHVSLCPGDLFLGQDHDALLTLSNMLMLRQSEWHHASVLVRGFSAYTSYQTLSTLEQTHSNQAFYLGNSKEASMLIAFPIDFDLTSQTMEYWLTNGLSHIMEDQTIGFQFMTYLDAVYGDYTKWLTEFENRYPFGTPEAMKYEEGIHPHISSVEKQIEVLKAVYGEEVLDNFYPWLQENEALFYNSAIDLDLQNVDCLNIYPRSYYDQYFRTTQYNDLYINIEPVKKYYSEYRGLDISDLYLRVCYAGYDEDGTLFFSPYKGVETEVYHEDGSVTTESANQISLEGVRYVKFVGEGVLRGLTIGPFQEGDFWSNP